MVSKKVDQYNHLQLFGVNYSEFMVIQSILKWEKQWQKNTALCAWSSG